MSGTQGGLARAVRIMDRLRSPGGCPWDAQQDHRSLAKYLIEEAYEAVDAIASGEREDIKEELGDVLLQVLFHARIAEEDQGAPFTIDDIADALADKLERRHPHVFADVHVDGADEVNANWDAIKAAEKGRSGVYDGLTWAQPTLSLAAAVHRRSERAGTPIEFRGEDPSVQVAERLMVIVAEAERNGIDAELALRNALRTATTSA